MCVEEAEAGEGFKYREVREARQRGREPEQELQGPLPFPNPQLQSQL